MGFVLGGQLGRFGQHGSGKRHYLCMSDSTWLLSFALHGKRKWNVVCRPFFFNCLPLRWKKWKRDQCFFFFDDFTIWSDSYGNS